MNTLLQAAGEQAQTCIINQLSLSSGKTKAVLQFVFSGSSLFFLSKAVIHRALETDGTNTDL